MALRASAELAGESVDVGAVVRGDGGESGVDAGVELVAFAEAAVGGDDAALPGARERLRARVGDTGLVDAAAVVGNFERMVRIADGAGIPLDGPIKAASEGLREKLGVEAYGSARNTPPVSLLERRLGRTAQALLFGVLRWIGRRRHAGGGDEVPSA